MPSHYSMKAEIWPKYLKYSSYCFYSIDYLAPVIVKHFDTRYIHCSSE